MSGLAASRWAPGAHTRTTLHTHASRAHTPSTSTQTPSSSKTVPSQPQPQVHPTTEPDHLAASTKELQRFLRIVRRLKWKIPDLARGYREAVDRVGPDVDRALVEEAALMFKLDFFEYYMLIERALVHLLGVFGVSISRGFESHHVPALTGGSEHVSHSTLGGTETASNGTFTPRSLHRYHANVLKALDNPENPLHVVLGTGQVRRELGRAKELRNRWKNIDEMDDGDRGARTYLAAPLESYNLEQIISTIFEGFDGAYVVAEQYVMDEHRKATGGAATDSVGEMMDSQDQGFTDEEAWEFMTEAMDWEAV